MGVDKWVVSARLATSLDRNGRLSEDGLGFVVLVVFVGPALVVLLIGLGVSLDIPRVVHHQREVVVVVDARRDVVVVLRELLKGHF